MAPSEPFADSVGEDSRIRHRLTVGPDDATCDHIFALQSPSGLIRRRRPGRRLLRGRHPRERRAKNNQYRGHHVFHCQYMGRANYLGASPILACLLRSVGHRRKPRRQGWAALPGSLLYLRAGSRVNLTVVSAPLLTVTRCLTWLVPGALLQSFWPTLTITLSLNSYSPGANLSITNLPFPSALAPPPPEPKAG